MARLDGGGGRDEIALGAGAIGREDDTGCEDGGGLGTANGLDLATGLDFVAGLAALNGLDNATGLERVAGFGDAPTGGGAAAGFDAGAVRALFCTPCTQLANCWRRAAAGSRCRARARPHRAARRAAVADSAAERLPFSYALPVCDRALRGRSAGGRTIGLRADMDALPMEEGTDLPFRSRNPGRFHGCGHDGHMTMLLGAVDVFTGIFGMDFDTPHPVWRARFPVGDRRPGRPDRVRSLSPDSKGWIQAARAD